jgi:hypothetical protein
MAKRPAKVVETAPVAAPTGVPDLVKLAALVAATKSGGFLYIPPNDPDLLLLTALRLAATNEELKDEGGNVAVRATPEGIRYMDLNEPQPDVAPTAAVTHAIIAPNLPKVTPVFNFAIDTDVTIPTIKRGGAGRQPTFPFENLEVGQSFHVPVSEERPEPAKTLASTVSSANARYAKETGEFETVTVKTYAEDASGKRIKQEGHYVLTGEKQISRAKTTQERKFVLRSVDASDKRGAGARIFRLR